MAKQIAKLLKTDVMADIDLPAIAQFLQSQGRRGDSILAHINPKEAALLQRMGGAATENPMTGLPEFYEGDAEKRDYSYKPPAKSYELTQRDILSALNDTGGVSPSRLSAQEVMPAEGVEVYNDPFFKDSYSAQTITPDYLSDYNYGVNSKPGVPTRQQFDIEFPGGQPQFSDAGYLGDPVFQTQFTPGYYGGSVGREIAARRLSDGSYQSAGVYPRNLRSIGDLSPIPENINRIPSEFATRMDFPEREVITGGEALSKAGEERGLVRRGVDYLKEATGLSGNELARLGLAAGLGIQGAMGAREMAEQGRQARAEQEEIARPYRERGATLIQQAEAGQLTPQGQQSLAAMRARLAQGAEARGGVGAQQAAAQIENYRQQLLANQYDYGMKISNIGDQLTLGAIRTGLEADRYATKMTNSYYTNMARILVGMGANNADVEQITKPRV